ncbi:hypothetical protein APR12_001636 [Nocardia amikacinitolerans]|uniref:hypothetical protein n=1 Tax=Nocardia amikacinitolerans TaxID=756689 RepID=UPI00082B843A|nr:hypothetical protein [Nocardia amikacinitolerans]MCP2316299.1 hypothetical protein [Nocardia amikacinitolerans]
MNTDRTETRRATTEPIVPSDRTPGADLESRGATTEHNPNLEARGANASPDDNLEARSANSAPSNNIDAPGNADSTAGTDRGARDATDSTPADGPVHTSGDSPTSVQVDPTATRDARTTQAVHGDGAARDNTTAAIPHGAEVAAPTSSRDETPTTATDSLTETSPSPEPAEETSAPDKSVTQSTAPAAETTNGKPTAPHDEPISLFTEAEIERLRTEWRTVQGSFIDNPGEAVSHADNLVANTIDHLTAAYSEHRRALTTRWSEDPDTEDLRNTLRAYRTFFNQLLT